MTFYFSGVRTRSELAMLAAAGVTHLLVDRHQVTRLGEALDAWPGKLALDCGAYADYKKNRRCSAADYSAFIGSLAHPERYDFIVSLDVIGRSDSQRQSRANYEHLRRDWPTLPLMPVWHDPLGRYEKPDDDLRFYLDQAPVVGLGGLVNAMRQKADWLMTRFPDEWLAPHAGRFHLFGANYLAFLDRHGHLAASADSSKWLDGGRYGHVIFTHSRSGRLQQAPARAIPAYAALDRRERCILSAANLHAHLARQSQRWLAIQ